MFGLVIPTLLLVLSSSVSAIWLNPDNTSDLERVTALIADGLMDYDAPEKGIGMFADPYYWWQAGGAWGSMLDYWFYMENDTYANATAEAMLNQVGDNWDFVPLNQSTTEGNDDQGFWGILAMAAVERNFPNPPEDQPQWLYLAQAVFNTMASRWDDATCNGGLRWQIFQWNSGYDYKNAVSNGCLFHIAARLARYTGNQTYVEWADKVHDWMYELGLVHESDYYFIYDGVSVGDNCSTVTKLQWTYNQGLIMAGSAYLANFTEEEKWKNRTTNYLKSSSVFFNNSVMYEAACQNANNCNNDQRSFRAYFSRFLGLTAQLVPDTYDHIYDLLDASARGASNSCSGGSDGHTCGINWSHSGWDGYYGLGEQMCALEVMQNLRIRDRPAPYTADDGGTSEGNPAAGLITKTKSSSGPLDLDGGDKAGAAIITCVVGLSLIGSAVWILL